MARKFKINSVNLPTHHQENLPTIEEKFSKCLEALYNEDNGMRFLRNLLAHPSTAKELRNLCYSFLQKHDPNGYYAFWEGDTNMYKADVVILHYVTNASDLAVLRAKYSWEYIHVNLNHLPQEDVKRHGQVFYMDKSHSPSLRAFYGAVYILREKLRIENIQANLPDFLREK